VGGISEFLDIEGDRTFLDIMTFRGVKISEYSVYPNESEILLLPGTVLKVIDQLDMGNGLVVVQLREIPSQREISEILLKDMDAIQFWTTIANDKFEIPLEDFCQALLIKTGSPIVKKLTKSSDLEAYQKYWGLWIFCGGDVKILSAYTKETLEPFNIPNSYCMMSLHRFGLLLAWFGHFSTLIDELYNAIQLGMVYDDSFTGPIAVNLLSNKNSSFQWLIRCSPKRDFPYTISYAEPTDTDPGVKISHQRILFNPSTRQYIFINLKTNEKFMSESIIFIINTIQKEYRFGEGLKKNNLSIITNPEILQYNLYVGDI
jgi:hypothetical protein